MKQENYFVVIPHPILRDKNLSDVDKLVYGEISALTNKEGYCFASNKYIGEVLNKSAMTARRSIYKLRELGYLYVENSDTEGENTQRKIYLDMQKMNRGMFKNEHPPRSKMNTIDNKLDNKVDKLAEPKSDKSDENVDKHVDIVVEKTNLRTGKNEETMRFTLAPKKGSIGEVIRSKSGKEYQVGPGYAVVKDNDPVRTEHQAYGLEAVNDLNLPSQYRGRIINSVKGKPLHVIEKAVEGTVKKGLAKADERARYFFAILQNSS